ncbi:hypothetical protein F5Y15DRAFT_237498 [Xylariaceae sp. FL0016]|nr:hypothetical protein F5Y15DRAFT_237498 [Xylariaceae sp. FL0016]
MHLQDIRGPAASSRPCIVMIPDPIQAWKQDRRFLTLLVTLLLSRSLFAKLCDPKANTEYPCVFRLDAATAGVVVFAIQHSQVVRPRSRADHFSGIVSRLFGLYAQSLKQHSAISYLHLSSGRVTYVRLK